MGTKKKMTLFEMPELKLIYQYDDCEEVCCAIRNLYPKHSQLIVAAILRDLLDINIVDMKAEGYKHEELYKTFSYGNGMMKCYRKGSRFDGVLEHIKNTNFVGLTSNFARSSGIVADFIKYAKKHNPKAVIIVGGVDATIRYEYYLKAGADYIILGEGEIVGRNLLSSLLKKRGVDKLTGIAYREAGRIVSKPRVKAKDIPNIDEVPLPAFDLIGDNIRNYVEAFEGPLPRDVSTPIAILDTSRGCNRACPFCSTPVVMDRYRFMSTNKIRQCLEHYRENGVKTLLLMEDNLLSRLDYPSGRKFVIDFFDMMIGYGFAWEFGNGIEIGKLVNEEIDQELIRKLFYNYSDSNGFIGCYRAYIPLESLHDSAETIYAKLVKYDLEKNIIEAIASTGIKMLTFGVIIGKQNETHNTVQLTRDRCLEIRILCEKYDVDVYFTPFIDTMIPGTANSFQNKDKVVYNVNDYPELFHFHSAAVNTSNFGYEQIMQIKKVLEKDINGETGQKYWARTGKYYFKKYKYEDLIANA